MLTGHERHIDQMRNHPGDRHVAAAALEAGAHLIVTQNLKDFREHPAGIGAVSPDAFLLQGPLIGALRPILRL